jgi:hypothetical protein
VENEVFRSILKIQSEYDRAFALERPACKKKSFHSVSFSGCISVFGDPA